MLMTIGEGGNDDRAVKRALRPYSLAPSSARLTATATALMQMLHLSTYWFHALIYPHSWTTPQDTSIKSITHSSIYEALFKTNIQSALWLKTHGDVTTHQHQTNTNKYTYTHACIPQSLKFSGRLFYYCGAQHWKAAPLLVLTLGIVNRPVQEHIRVR